MTSSIAWDRIVYVAAGILLLVLIINFITLAGLSKELDTQIASAKEASKPAEISLTSITTTSCADCFDINPILTALEDPSVLIKTKEEVDVNSAAAKALALQYGITKFPTVIVTGQTEKLTLEGFTQKEGALVFENIAPPYVDTEGKIIGNVATTLLNDATCTQCADISSLPQQLRGAGIYIGTQSTLDYNSREGKPLVEANEVAIIPAIVISKDVEAYPAILQSLIRSGGRKTPTGDYVYESPAPYIELSTGALRGLVKLTILNDSSCAECYDVDLHRQILSRRRMAIGEEIVVDISTDTGKALIAKYNIQSVPTILLTGDLEPYSLDQVWSQVGTVDADGTYVFHNLNVLGPITFKNLTSGTLVIPTPDEIP